MAHRKVPPVAPQYPLDHQKSPRGAAEASNLREFPRPTTSHFKIPRVDVSTVICSVLSPFVESLFTPGTPISAAYRSRCMASRCATSAADSRGTILNGLTNRLCLDDNGFSCDLACIASLTLPSMKSVMAVAVLLSNSSRLALAVDCVDFAGAEPSV